MKITTDDKAASLTYEQMSELQAKGDTLPAASETSLLPERYGSVNTTDLAFTVNASGNDFTIELKD